MKRLVKDAGGDKERGKELGHDELAAAGVCAAGDVPPSLPASQRRTSKRRASLPSQLPTTTTPPFPTLPHPSPPAGRKGGAVAGQKWVRALLGGAAR